MGRQAKYGEGEGAPILPEDELLRRREAVRAARAQHEQRCLAAERERWGVTRQTRVRPISEMVA